MGEDRFHPWIIGTEHLGDTIVRIHFGGGVVRDVDLRAVLSTEELTGLLEGPASVGDVRTTVMWPNGLHLAPEMLDLIYAGFGARKGWPEIERPERPARPDAPFPVPSLEDMRVTTYGNHDPAQDVVASSAAPWCRQKIDALLERFRSNVDELLLWWTEARGQLPDASEAEDRRRLLRRGMTDVAMVRMALDSLEEYLRDAAWGDAVASAESDVQSLVADATRWNEVWVVEQAVAATAVIDPLENPHGFCEELRARLRSPGGSSQERSA